MHDNRPIPFYRYLDAVLASELPQTEERVALVIARCANAEGVAWPGLKTIIERTGKKRRGVLAAVANLEALGWLVVERVALGHARAQRGTGNRYRLGLPPAHQVQPAAPGGDPPTTTSPDQVQPDAPDQVQPEARPGAVHCTPPGAVGCTKPGSLPLSGIEPIKRTSDRTTRARDPDPVEADRSRRRAIGLGLPDPALAGDPLPGEELEHLLGRWRTTIGKPPPITAARARAAWRGVGHQRDVKLAGAVRGILETAAQTNDPRGFVERALGGFRHDGYAMQQGHPFEVFAKDPASYDRRPYNAQSDFSHVDPADLPDWLRHEPPATELELPTADRDVDATVVGEAVPAKGPRKADPPRPPDDDDEVRIVELTRAVRAEHERRIVASGAKHGNLPSPNAAYDEARRLAVRSLREHPDDAERWALRVVAGMFSLIGRKPSWDQLRRHTDRELAQAGEHADAA